MLLYSVILYCLFADVAFSGVAPDVQIYNMIREIAQTYFSDSPCVALISGKTEPLSNVNLEELPVIRIIVGEKAENIVLNAEDSSSASGKSVQEFERLLVQTLDACCLGYIVQVPNIKVAINSFTRAVKRTTQRILRNYVFLPDMNTKDMDAFAEEVLRLNDLSSMPNIVIAKVHTSIPLQLSLEEALTLRKLYCTDTSPQGQGPYGTEEALLQGRKLIENLKLSFKDNTRDVVLPHPKVFTKSYVRNCMLWAVELVTQTFVGLNPSEEVFLDMWMQFQSEGYFVLCADLYPDKTRDLQGKIITAIAIPYLPFVIMDHYADPPLHEGIEFLIYRELLKKLNGTSKVIYDPEHLWGAVFDNGTGNGVVGNVLNGVADIGFAAIYLNWYTTWLWTDFSYPYCQSAAILVVPRPKLLPGYYIPVLPFSLGMWVAILLSVLGISAYNCFLSAALRHFLPGFTKERVTISRSFLDTLAMLVLQIPNEKNEESHYSPWKHFITWVSMYFLLITSVYSGGLASILTVPRYERPIDTLVDMARSDLIWMFPHEAVIWAFRDSEDPVLKTIADKYIKVSDEELAVIALKGEVAIHIEELSGGTFCYGDYITIEAMSRLRLMREPILLAHVVLNAQKGGPYMKPLNDLILALNQGGLGTYWQADVVRHYLSSRLQLQIALSRSENDPDGTTLRTLQLFHVQGAFILLIVSLMIATIVFVIELATHRYAIR